MRRSKLLLLCSAVAPGCAYLLGGCFGSTSGGSNSIDGGLVFPDSGSRAEDSSLPSSEAGPAEAGPKDSGSDAGDASAVLPTGTIDFGLTECGSAAASKTYTIQNTGPVAVTYSATASSVFSITDGGSGTVAPGASASITLAVATVPTTSTAGTPITGTLTVTTNLPGAAPVQVPLSVTPLGGSLTLTPATVGFGQQEATTASAPLPFTLTNVGNAPISVALGTPSDPEFVITGSGGAIAAGAPLAGTSATFTPSSAGDKTATAAITVTGAMCASAVTAIPFSGTGVVAPVNIGPSPLDFGSPGCGAPAAPAQAVTIQNTGTVGITYTATLGLGTASPFTIDSASGSVAGAASGVIHVTPKPIVAPANETPGEFDDTLTITTSASGSTPVAIPLDMSASGALLTLSVPTANFGVVQNTTQTEPFTVTNKGNKDATLSFSTTGAGYSETVTGTDKATANGGTVSGTIAFKPSTNGDVQGTLVLSTTDPVCSPVIAPAFVVATGAVPVVGVSGTLAMTTTCGATGGQAIVSVANTGNAPATLAFAPAAGAAFSIVGTQLTSLAANSSGKFTIQGLVPNPGTTPASATPITTNLLLTTNEPTGNTHSYPVANTISGANLSFATPTTATYACTPGAPPTVVDGTFAIINTGTQTATLTGGPHASSTPQVGGVPPGNGFISYPTSPFTSSAGVATIAPGVPGSGTSHITSICALTGTETFPLTITSTTGICVAPSPLTLTVPFAVASSPTCMCIN